MSAVVNDAKDIERFSYWSSEIGAAPTEGLRLALPAVRAEGAQAHHPLGCGIPDFQTQTTNNFTEMQRRGFRRLQLGNRSDDFRQSVERDPGIQVMNVVIADIGREPARQRTRAHETGGLQRRLVIGPTGIVAERHGGKIVLGVKEITANGARNKVGKQ